MHNANSGSSVVVQQGWVSPFLQRTVVFLLPFTEVLGRRISEVPTNLSRSQPILSALSYIAVSYPGYKSSTG